MKEEFRNLVSELKNVRTIDLASVSRTVLEKFFWTIIGILGIAWAIYFLPNQFELWSNNPSILLLKDVPLSDIPYPLLSIIPKGITKYAVAERLGNYVLPDQLPEKLKRLREIIFEYYVLSDYYAKSDLYDSTEDEGYKKAFFEDCFETTLTDCEVSVKTVIQFISINMHSFIFKVTLKAMAYAMQNGLRLDDLFIDMKANFSEHGFFNLKEFASNFEPIGKENNLTNLTFFDGFWIYAYQLYDTNGRLDIRSQRIGTLFIKLLQYIDNNDYAYKIILSKEIDKVFTLPNCNVSLQNIVQLYSTLNSDVLSGDNDILKETKPEFLNCFDAVYDVPEEQTSTGFYDETNLMAMNKSKFNSPCEKNQFITECKKYCKWHVVFFNGILRQDFLSLMKYSLPQPRIVFNNHFETEQEMAKKLFGVANVGNLSHQIAPNAMPVFCFSKMNGYNGDKTKMPTKVCNEFKLMPSDSGISISSNKVNLKKILQFGRPYEALFETNEVGNDNEPKIKGGNRWSQQTYVINTGYSNRLEKIVGSKKSSDLDFVKIHLHQSGDLPHFRNDSHFDKSIIPLDLRAGYEYTIDVVPIGQISSKEFEGQSLKQRNCFLKTEGLKNSIFNIYTENICNYECHVKLSREVCKCQPWDFFAIDMEHQQECDVFGRKRVVSKKIFTFTF